MYVCSPPPHTSGHTSLKSPESESKISLVIIFYSGSNIKRSLILIDLF